MRAIFAEIHPNATVAQAAGVGAAVLAGTLRARAVVIHVHDERSGELRVVGADGEGASDLLGATCTADDDLVASAVLANDRLMKLRFEDDLPSSAPDRLRRVGAARSLLAVPVMEARRCIAIIEVIDADESIAHRAADACGRAAEALLRCHAARLAS